ncbi:MAG: hypothetical protein ACWA47_12215 [Brevirhabdus sp.]
MWIDYIFVIGAVMLAWGIVRGLSSFVDNNNRSNVMSSLAMGSGLVFYAAATNPGRYSIDNTPNVLLSMAQQLF